MELFIYLIKVNIAIVVMYCFYGLLLRNDTFFRSKRILLLSIPLIAMLYPLIDVSWFLNNEMLIFSNNKIFPSYYLNEVIITITQKQPGSNFSFANYFPVILSGIYYLGVIVLIIGMLKQISGVFFLLLQTQKMQINGQTIYRKEGLQTPFSFFHYIVLDPQQYLVHELQEIIRHEETHVRQCHSLDMIMAEIMTAFCWFNPIIWLIRNEIRVNLEYLADRSVIDSGLSREHYQFHLLRLTYHKAAAKITNNFNVSPLKKRIFMMNKKETSRLGLAKYLVVLPVIAALLIFNNCDKNTKKTEVPEIKTGTETVETTPSENIFTHVEEMPNFPGGDVALMKWLKENITYPTSASEKGVQGRVNLRFIIRSDGSIDDIKIVKSLDQDCDAEAVRALKEMPKWIPGKQGGKPVSVYFNLPVQFRLK